MLVSGELKLVMRCSRAFIRAVMEDPDYPVTSPTFTLQNIYDEHEGEECC